MPLPNVWLGVSVEDQTRADERIPALLDTPAAVRFISAEPLLGPVDLEYPKSIWPDGPPRCCSGWECGCYGRPTDPPLFWGIDWVIVGGESGPGARPMHLEWARNIKDKCATAGVPCFVKQLGKQAVMNRQDAVQPVGLGAGWESRPGHDMGLISFRHPKGGDMAEWPADMRVQQMPRGAP